MAQDPDFIARFRDYNDYLDSLIAEEDIRYLQDGELARLVGNTMNYISICDFGDFHFISGLLLSSPIEEQVEH